MNNESSKTIDRAMLQKLLDEMAADAASYEEARENMTRRHLSMFGDVPFASVADKIENGREVLGFDVFARRPANSCHYVCLVQSGPHYDFRPEIATQISKERNELMRKRNERLAVSDAKCIDLVGFSVRYGQSAAVFCRFLRSLSSK